MDKIDIKINDLKSEKEHSKIILENIALRRIIKLYEISTKLDYKKIENLKKDIEHLNKLIIKIN